MPCQPEFFPARAFDDLVEALTKCAAGNTQSIDGTRIGLDQIVLAKFKRIDAKIMRDLIQVYLHGIARLCRSMTALWTTWRLVGKKAHAFEFISRKFLCHSMKRTRVVSACYAIGTIGTAIKKRTKVHRRQCSIMADAGLDPHFDRMASSMDQKHFLASTGDFYWPAGATSEFGGTDFMREWVALPTKSAANIGCNHRNMRLWHSQHFAQLAVHIMRRLRRRPQGQLAANRIGGIRLPVCNAGMRFNRSMVVAFIVKPVFTDVIRFGKTGLDLTKFIRNGFVNIANTRFIVNFHFGMRQRLINTHQSGQHLIFYLNELYRFVEDVGIECCNGDYRITHVTYLIDCQGILILAGGENAILER